MFLTSLDLNTITTIIGSVGFPIVACFSMAFYVKEMSKQQRNDTLKLNEEHTKEMLAFKDEIKEALNNNTIALTRLCDKLDNKEVLNNDRN